MICWIVNLLFIKNCVDDIMLALPQDGLHIVGHLTIIERIK